MTDYRVSIPKPDYRFLSSSYKAEYLIRDRLKSSGPRRASSLRQPISSAFKTFMS